MQQAFSKTGPEATRVNLLALLCALVFFLVVAPLLEQTGGGWLLLLAGRSAIIVAAVVMIHRRRSYLTAIGILAAVDLALMWTHYFVPAAGLVVAGNLAGILLIVVISGYVLRTSIVERRATVDAIFGAICVYLLLGTAWALAYATIDVVDTDAFLFPIPLTGAIDPASQYAAMSQFVYFSFVTMSTLGYGDITPQLPLAQTLTWLQSVTGQFYLAVLVARLVSAMPHPVPRHGATAGKPGK